MKLGPHYGSSLSRKLQRLNPKLAQSSAQLQLRYPDQSTSSPKTHSFARPPYLRSLHPNSPYLSHQFWAFNNCLEEASKEAHKSYFEL